MKHFWKRYDGNVCWEKQGKQKFYDLKKVHQQQNANHFWKKINCHDKIPWQFPDIGQMDKIPRHFFKIPWQFPDLEKILFFPDFSLTRGNPDSKEYYNSKEMATKL